MTSRGGSKRAFTATILDQGLNSAINLTVGLAIAKSFGIERFGVFVTGITLSFLVASIVSAMTYTVAAVDIVRIRRSKATYLSHVEAMAAALSLLVALPISGVWLVTLAKWSPYTSFVLLYACLLGVFESSRRMSYLRDDGARTFRLTAIRGLVVGAAAASGAAGGIYPMLALLVLHLLLGVAPTLTRLALTRGWHAGYFGRVLRQGLPLALSVVLSTGFEQIVVLLAAKDLGAETVGGWRAASYLFGLWAPFLISFDAFLPRILHARFGGAMRVPLPYLLLLGVPASMSCMATSWITTNLYLPYLGPEFQTYAPTAYLYTLVYVAIIMKLALSVTLRREDTRHMTVANLFGATFGMAAYLSHAVGPDALLAFSIAVSHLTSLAAMSLIAMRLARSSAAMVGR